MKKMQIKKGLIFLTFLIILLMNVSAQEEMSMYIEIISENEILSVGDVGLSEGVGSNKKEEFPDYYAIVSSLSGDSFQVNFSLVPIIFHDNFATGEGGTEFLDKVSLLLFFPYYRDVDKLDVYTTEREHLLSYDLSNFRVCVFDEICAPYETAEVCPEDCGEPELLEEVEDDFEERYEESMKEKEIQELSFIEQNKMYLIIGLGVLVFLLIILILKNRRK